MTLERRSITVEAMEVMTVAMMMIISMTLTMEMKEMRVDYLGGGCSSKRYEDEQLWLHHETQCSLVAAVSIHICSSLGIFQLFDRKFVDAVLNEWQRTMMDLPAGFRQACEMVGLS